MPRNLPFRRRHAVLILLVCGGIAGGLAVAFGGSSNYDGPSCKPHSPMCRQSANNGPWIPYWYYTGLVTAQRIGAGSAGSAPSVYGQQPTAEEEEADGASDAEAEEQQTSQQNYVSSASESAEGSEDQADGDDSSGGGDEDGDDDDDGN